MVGSQKFNSGCVWYVSNICKVFHFAGKAYTHTYCNVCMYVYKLAWFVYEMWLVTEKLHNARLERERVIAEQQLQQQIMPHKVQRKGKPRSQAVTLPAAVSKDKKKSNSVAQGKVTKKAVGGVKERHTKSATLPISDVSKSPSSTHLPSVVASLPEKV